MPLPHVPAPHPTPGTATSMPTFNWYVATVDPPPLPVSLLLAVTRLGFNPLVVVIEAMDVPEHPIVTGKQVMVVDQLLLHTN